jgi:hypothetical protein
MKLEKDIFKMKRLISEMLICEVENAKSKNKGAKNLIDNSNDFLKSKKFRALASFVIEKDIAE